MVFRKIEMFLLPNESTNSAFILQEEVSSFNLLLICHVYKVSALSNFFYSSDTALHPKLKFSTRFYNLVHIPISRYNLRIIFKLRIEFNLRCTGYTSERVRYRKYKWNKKNRYRCIRNADLTESIHQPDRIIRKHILARTIPDWYAVCAFEYSNYKKLIFMQKGNHSIADVTSQQYNI